MHDVVWWVIRWVIGLQKFDQAALQRLERRCRVCPMQATRLLPVLHVGTTGHTLSGRGASGATTHMLFLSDVVLVTRPTRLPSPEIWTSEAASLPPRVFGYRDKWRLHNFFYLRHDTSLRLAEVLMLSPSELGYRTLRSEQRIRGAGTRTRTRRTVNFPGHETTDMRRLLLLRRYAFFRANARLPTSTSAPGSAHFLFTYMHIGRT